MVKELNKSKSHKAGVVHYVTLLGMAAFLFYIAFFTIMPMGMAAFVESLFAPSADEQVKIGWVKFEGRVWGTCSKNMESQNMGKPVAKSLINGEYILDFTWEERAVAKHGYSKKSSEWYATAPLLGEHAIIIEPYIAMPVLAFVFALVLSLLITMFMPASFGFMAVLFEKTMTDTRIKLRLQTGFADDIIDLLVMPDKEFSRKDVSEVRRAFRLVWDRTNTEDTASPFAQMKFDDIYDEDINIVEFRNGLIFSRIKETFSDFVIIEIEDMKNALVWKNNRLHFLKGLRLYMAHDFCEKYQNFTTGLAYGGAALLIIAIGIRGIKFIPPTKPSFILAAITLEFSMLLLLAVTLLYTESEERIDKLMKKMEDANRSQLEALRGQQVDIHQLSNALVGQTAEIIKNRVEGAIEEYMMSGDHIQKVVAEEIARKIIFSVRDDSPSYNERR